MHASRAATVSSRQLHGGYALSLAALLYAPAGGKSAHLKHL